ncbi:hypothetical protein C5167_040511 [Papaver somniferum]|uniref:Uncharacterized protein n=1 Tax=Papaver somniferum TaxID=3469 RepID=A0A4Y7IJD3_PAPSO|nr:hypothetical protein C5167_040511 [Papaver somniferum]
MDGWTPSLFHRPLKRRAPRQAGFTEQRTPPDLDSGSLGNRGASKRRLQAYFVWGSGSTSIFVYAVFGLSRQITTGPVPITLVYQLVSNVVGKIADPTDDCMRNLRSCWYLWLESLEYVMANGNLKGLDRL